MKRDLRHRVSGSAGILFLTGFFALLSCYGFETQERLEWEWTKTEKSSLDFLVSQAKRDDKGYWILKGNSFTVRSNVSKELTAGASRYVERMLEQIPRILGFPVIRGKQQFILTIHKTKSDSKSDSGAAEERDPFFRVQKDAAGATAAVHITTDDAESEGGDIPLADRINLRLLQRETMLALLELNAGGRELSTFISEGCAAFFEFWDLREEVPRRSSRMAAGGRAAYLRALQGAVIESGRIQPDLAEIYLQPPASFSGDDADLNNALALSFADFLLSSQKNIGRLSPLLYTENRRDASTWMTPFKTLLELEEAWHEHICRILSETLYVRVIDIPVGGQPAGNPSVAHLDRYGVKPQIAVCPAEKGGYDIGWHDPSTRAIHVLKCGPDNAKLGEITPAEAGDTAALLGFCNIPGKEMYLAGHCKDNESGNKNAEFWITAFNGKGEKIFATRIFGEQNSDLVHSKGYPGAAGSSRLVYNPSAKKVGVYVAHTMKWPDNVRHQAGYLSLLSLSGENKEVSGWYVSHNFDQRMIVKDGDFYLLAHGDAYPRALVFSKRNAGGGQVFSTNYHAIPGESGDNNTWCQTGAVVVQDDKSSAVIFASSNSRESHDICIKLFDASGKEVKEMWLTQYRKGTIGAYPRLAAYEGGLLAAWEQSGDGAPMLQCLLTNPKLAVQQKQRGMQGARISPFNDFVNLESGAVVWAAAGIGNTIRVYRVDGRDQMFADLTNRLRTEKTKTAKTRAVPGKGVMEQIDAAVLKKLTQMSGEKKLPDTPLRLSMTKATVRLIAADEKGSLTFMAGTGTPSRTAALVYSELSTADKALIAGALVAEEPDNAPLCGVAGFYMLAAGQRDMSRVFFAKAGRDIAKKYRAYFVGTP